MVAAGLAIIHLFPRITKAIPSPLVAILVLSTIAIVFHDYLSGGPLVHPHPCRLRGASQTCAMREHNPAPVGLLLRRAAFRDRTAPNTPPATA
jgi:hypothetical protein